MTTLAARAVMDFFRTGVRYEFEMTWNDVLQVQYRVVEKVA